jgi:hypothetical protein
MSTAAMYFYRSVPWNLVDGRLTIHATARVVTMDPWFEQVFLEADGARTVDELAATLAAEYEAGAPAGLRGQVVRIVEQLVARGFVKLSATPRELPTYLRRPLFDQDPAVYREQMMADGFIEG